MLVKKLRTSMGAEGMTRAGQVIDVTDHRARQLIDKGLARAVLPNEPRTQLAMPRRTQQVPARRTQAAEDPGPLAVAEDAQTGSPTGAEPSPSLSPADPAPPSPDATDSERPRRRGRRKSSASTEAGS